MAAVTAADIHWPGVDRDRAELAVYHLGRTLVHLAAWRSLSELEAPPWVAPAPARLAMAREHLQLAVGYLGAVGFEHGAALLWPSAGRR